VRSKAVIGLISWEETDSLPAAWLAEYSWSIPRILGQHCQPGHWQMETVCLPIW